MTDNGHAPTNHRKLPKAVFLLLFLSIVSVKKVKKNVSNHKCCKITNEIGYWIHWKQIKNKSYLLFYVKVLHISTVRPTETKQKTTKHLGESNNIA